ncbi:MAG: hypothetical protein V1492_04000, partial [Candidatus Micrarchaeota archaeon]
CMADESLCFYNFNDKKDFIWFVDCIVHLHGIGPGDTFAKTSSLDGERRLALYEYLNQKCSSASCPSWKVLDNATGGNISKTVAMSDNPDPYADYKDYYDAQKK